MNQDLIDFIKSDTPPLNPILAEGLAVEHSKHLEEYLHSVFEAVLSDLKETAGIEYLGFERVSPMEEFIEQTKGKNNGPRQYNMARTDTYMVKMKLKHKDTIHERYLSLPFIGRAGMFHVHGTNYSVTPVLADKIISVTPPKLFVRLMSVRLNFEKENYHFIANGIRETYPVIKSEVYKSKDKKAKKFVPDTPLVFYLLCQCGMSQMFRHYLGTDVIYGLYGEDITEERYPEDQYVICRSLGQKHRKLSVKDYLPTNVAIVVPKDKFTPTMKSIIAGCYYILDQFVEEINIDAFDDMNAWRMCLGMVLFNHEVNPGKLITDVNDHLSSVDQYIDEIMKVKFKRINMNIQDMYQLFFVIIDKFEEWQNQFMNKEADLYNKELIVLYYLCLDITRQMVNFGYRIKKKNKGGNLSENDVRDAIRSCIKPDAINNVKKEHGEINVVNYSGDNMAFGVTHALIPQDKTSSTRKVENSNLSDPTKRLHVSHAEVRSYSGVAKTAPDGSTRLNLHLNIDKEGSIIRDPELMEMLDTVQKEITRS